MDTSAAVDDQAKRPEDPAPAAAKLLPLPQGYIDSILAFERETWPASSDDDLEHLSPEERREIEEMAALYKELDDDFERFQAEVCRQVENNGCDLVDEGYFIRQARIESILEEEWAKFDFSRVDVGEWDGVEGCFK